MTKFLEEKVISIQSMEKFLKKKEIVNFEEKTWDNFLNICKKRF